jgi:hypothetical protein
MPSINNFLSGFSNGLPGMKDYQHASRLFIDDRHRLQPKNKWLFHVVINLADELKDLKFGRSQQLELNMLVKSCQLPKYDMNVEQKQQYNKKVNLMTHISYQPINIVFYDDHVDTVNAFWNQYLQLHNVDSQAVRNSGGVEALKRDTYYNGGDNQNHQYGMDGNRKRNFSFIRSIEIFALNRKQFTSFTLINPTIGSWSHDDLDAADGAGIMYNTMQVFYETVLYGAGNIAYSPDNTLGSRGPQGFATIHYDLSPSPLSVLGGGTTSIFGPGGIVEGIGSVIGDVATGNVNLGTILKGINTYINAKKIKAKDAVKEELKGIAKEGVLDIGKQAGTITNPVGNFNVGSAVTAAVAVGAATANAKGSVDDTTNKSRVKTNVVIDTENFLSPTESFNIVSNNASIRDEIAAGIYYKQVGSRQGQTVAESDVAYAALTEQQKNVYRSRVTTDINKLVTQGFIKIKRDTNDVTVITERANI